MNINDHSILKSKRPFASVATAITLYPSPFAKTPYIISYFHNLIFLYVFSIFHSILHFCPPKIQSFFLAQKNDVVTNDYSYDGVTNDVERKVFIFSTLW